jgi:hypothetical protein
MRMKLPTYRTEESTQSWSTGMPTSVRRVQRIHGGSVSEMSPRGDEVRLPKVALTVSSLEHCCRQQKILRIK